MLYLPSEIMKAWKVEPGDYVSLTPDMDAQTMTLKVVRGI